MALHYFENCLSPQYVYNFLNYIVLSFIVPEPSGGKTVTLFESNQPSQYDLEGLYNSSCKNMMDVKSSWDSYYWSATTYAHNTNDAWRVNFYDGLVSNNYKSDSYYVRAVRAAQ